MDTPVLLDKFARIGARLKVLSPEIRRGRFLPEGTIRLDIRADRDGEYFEVQHRSGSEPEVAVLDVQPRDRHLLLLVRNGAEKQKFLCGHDERHWFVAAVPEDAPVGTVRQAKESLKPGPVVDAQGRSGLRASARNRRKNDAYRRQGEWFFLPAPELVIDEKLVIRNEPLRRGAGKPHWCDFLYRNGGEDVWVHPAYPNGVTPDEYRQILDSGEQAGRTRQQWRFMKRNARVFVRGRVRHADHKTIVLHGWHEVLMNTETRARAMQHVAFLD